MKTGNNQKAAVAVSAGLLVLTSFANAQESNIDEADEIIVFGERAQRSLADTLSSVSVLNEEAVKERAQQDIYESIVGIPNTLFLDGSSLPAIRGQSNTSAGSSLGNAALTGVEPRTLLVIDDFARTPSWANGAYTSLFDVEQVEVFRGPQSTLRGRNAISGVVVMHTKDPTFEFEGSALAEGTYNDASDFGYRFAGAASGPLIADELAGRLAIQYQSDNDAFGEFLPGQFIGAGDPDDARALNTLSVRGKLLLTPQAASGLRVELSGQYVDFTSNLFQNSIAGPGTDPSISFDDRFQAFGGDFRLVNGESFFGGLDAAYELNQNHSFQLLVSYGDDTFSSDDELNSSAVIFDDSTDTILSVEGLWRFSNDTDNLSGFLAASYLRRRRVWDAGFVPPPPLTPVELSIDDTTNTYSIYGDVRLRATEKLELNFGGRILFTDQFRNFTFGAPVVTGEKFDDTAVLPQFGALYDVADNQTLGVSLRRGYGDGGRGANTQTFSSFEFDPETVWTLEGVYRYR